MAVPRFKVGEIYKVVERPDYSFGTLLLGQEVIITVSSGEHPTVKPLDLALWQYIRIVKNTPEYANGIQLYYTRLRRVE